MNSDLDQPWQHPTIIRHTQRLLNSFRHWTGRSLLELNASPIEISQALFEASFVVISHGTEADPIFNYGNQTALKLWELDWAHFTQTPSRQAAEPEEQRDRQELLQTATTSGFICTPQLIRVSSTGKRFRIANLTLWEVLDETNQRCGQAATFEQWEFI